MTQEKSLRVLWFKVCVKSHEHKSATNRHDKRVIYSQLKTVRRNFRKEALNQYGSQCILYWGYDYSCAITTGPMEDTGRKHYRFTLEEPL